MISETKKMWTGGPQLHSAKKQKWPNLDNRGLNVRIIPLSLGNCCLYQNQNKRRNHYRWPLTHTAAPTRSNLSRVWQHPDITCYWCKFYSLVNWFFALIWALATTNTCLNLQTERWKWTSTLSIITQRSEADVVTLIDCNLSIWYFNVIFLILLFRYMSAWRTVEV